MLECPIEDFLNNLHETGTYLDDEDRELLYESDNEFSCSDMTVKLSVINW